MARFAYDAQVVARFPAVVGGVIHATGLRNGVAPVELAMAFRAGAPVTPAVNDVELDRRIDVSAVPVMSDTVLLVDGIFLQRPELDSAWDAALFVDVPFAVSVPRGNARFAGPGDCDPDSESNGRYVGGQRLYLDEVRPQERATWVLDNTDLRRPRVNFR